MASSLYYYFSCALAYGLLLIAYPPRPKHLPAFSLAALASLIWSVVTLREITLDGDFNYTHTLPAETLRDVAWFVLLGVMLSRCQQRRDYKFLQQIRYVIPITLWTLITLSIELFPAVSELAYALVPNNPLLYAHVIFSITGLILIEQLYRNTPLNQRWHIKLLCLGLGLIFTIDLLMYSNSLLYNELDRKLWHFRGIVNAAAGVMLLISRHRLGNPANLTASAGTNRKMMFYTTVLFGCGLYLFAMSFTGFFLTQANEEWLEAVQNFFLALAITLLALPFTSGKIRALTKIYFTKHFFHYSYDYRVEWIKISSALAQLSSVDELKYYILDTLTQLVDSSGGGLWIRNSQNRYSLAAEQNLRLTPQETKYLASDNDLEDYLTRKQWVIDFNELTRAPEVYDDIDLSAWCYEDSQVWLIIPLLHLRNVEAFVILTQARAVRKLNWEDHDLLKTVGMQLANALALTRASEELAHNRQFEAYHRLSAFLVHDLKNLSAQLSLIVNNAAKYKNNPDFFDDTIDTLSNVIGKTQQMVNQLKQGQLHCYSHDVLDLVEVLRRIQQQHLGSPPISLENQLASCHIHADKTKLSNILTNLIQNAQDATRNTDGRVSIELTADDTYAVIKIIDNGIGMDEKFVSERLFKPFDTTKGNAGMGIGAYEAKDYIHKLAGHIGVNSQPGQGTTFTIQLPLADRELDESS